MGIVGRSEVVDADRVRLIDALRSKFGETQIRNGRKAD